MNLHDIIKGAQDELTERFKDGDEDLHDVLWEIADSHTPIYNADILELAANHAEIGQVEPEIGPAFDGTPTPINIAAANIFEAIYEALCGHSELLKEEAEEEEEDTDTIMLALRSDGMGINGDK